MKEIDFKTIISNVVVNGMEESIVASGYPMLAEVLDTREFQARCEETWECIYNDNKDNPNIKRALNLGSSTGGHDQFLSTWTVSVDLTLSNKVWVEMERYKFVTFCSSMSTMHRLSRMKVADNVTKYADKVIVERCQELVDKYNAEPTEENFLIMTRNIPADFMITARVQMSYRCLKNIYYQRKNHRQPEWKVICDWIRTLPMMDWILTRTEEKEYNKTTVGNTDVKELRAFLKEHENDFKETDLNSTAVLNLMEMLGINVSEKESDR